MCKQTSYGKDTNRKEGAVKDCSQKPPIDMAPYSAPNVIRHRHGPMESQIRNGMKFRHGE